MNLLEKLLLVGLGLIPFIFLFGNATRRITFSFLPATAISAACGAVFLFLFGLGRHPRISTIFLVLFALWPVSLIIARALNSALSWARLWLSVPLMSWFAMTIAIATDYPVSGAGGGLGMLVNLFVGWFYLLPIFGMLQLFYMAARK